MFVLPGDRVQGPQGTKCAPAFGMYVRMERRYVRCRTRVPQNIILKLSRGSVVKRIGLFGPYLLTLCLPDLGDGPFSLCEVPLGCSEVVLGHF